MQYITQNIETKIHKEEGGLYKKYQGGNRQQKTGQTHEGDDKQGNTRKKHESLKHKGEYNLRSQSGNNGNEHR